jgi:hypothetical protein
MALFDFLKPKWSAGKMTDDDRRRQFWSYKKATSHTAWQRCRDRYAVFVDLVERQCKEEPVGRLGPTEFVKYKARVERWVKDGEFPPYALNNLEDDHKTDWDASTYADVLRGLALYDKGLARLKQGDRSVFLHNSQGVLEDAYHAADRKFDIYYMGGPKGGDGMVFYGKYVAAMKAALLWANENGTFSAGGLQPMMANLSSPGVWKEPQPYTDDRGQRRMTLGTRETLIRETAHLKELPPVPEPVEEVLVRTGEPCPVFGIYEPMVKDGVMTYMCQGQEAFRYGEPIYHPGAGQPVTWRLIWEDNRYVDGVIPADEYDYFPEPVSPPDFSSLLGEELIDEHPRDELVTARSGQSARFTGTWAAVGDLSGRIYWKKGDPLPQLKGREVVWVYSGV